MVDHYDNYSNKDVLSGKTQKNNIVFGKYSADRSGCKDVFHAFFVKNAIYDGDLEIPRIFPDEAKPKKLIVFSKAIRSRDYDAWIHFYEDDASFERIWNNPRKYLPIIKKYDGVIAPDFSLYRDMPLVMQLWNIYRSHAIASWLQENGIPVIANVRWGDRRTFAICCNGVPKHATIAIGSHGCIKQKIEREFFIEGLEYVIQKLKPKTIIVYGTVPSVIFDKYKQTGIQILQFDSEYMISHRRMVV